MTGGGVLVNIDGNSNRVSCIAQGPKHVLFIVGMNKVCSDIDGAMKREPSPRRSTRSGSIFPRRATRPAPA